MISILPVFLIIPQTASAVRGSHALAKGRWDWHRQNLVAALAPHLPPTCPALAPTTYSPNSFCCKGFSFPKQLLL